ncbi:MAG: hypothetical protein R3Y29_03330 [bacterium]
MSALEVYKSKLQDKNQKLNIILEYTSSKDFKITTDEMQHIKNYSNKKTKLCKQIVAIDKELKALESLEEIQELEDQIELDQISLIINKNNAIIGKIIQVDDKNSAKMQQINDIIKANMKQLKASTKVTKTYNSTYDTFYGGNCFNKTK